MLRLLRGTVLSVGLLVSAASCRAAEPEAGPAPHPRPTPTVTSALFGKTMRLMVTFRSPKGVAISKRRGLELRIGTDVIRCPLVARPVRSVENADVPGQRVVIDGAGYTISPADFTRLKQTPADQIRVRLSDGRRIWTYPYVSGDEVETQFTLPAPPRAAP